jgi:hypothetical protein
VGTMAPRLRLDGRPLAWPGERASVRLQMLAARWQAQVRAKQDGHFTGVAVEDERVAL